MAEIEGFDIILGQIAVAKALHDIGRFDIVGTQFFDELCWDSYYENMLGVISSVFSGFHSDYSDMDETEYMEFTDEVISGYYIYAWEYGKRNNLRYSQNPYITQARDEAGRHLEIGCCMGWKLSDCISTKNCAKKSKLHIYLSNGCGNCNTYENLAHGLIHMYTWFADKCAEFKALGSPQGNKDTLAVCDKSNYREAMAA